MIRRTLAAAALSLSTPTAAQVAQSEATAAAATATAYAAADPLWACDPLRSDGFNSVFYAAHNADVVAARMDMLDHWTRYGQREGRQPCDRTVPTQAQAKAATATLSLYAAQPVPIAAPADDGYGRDASRADGWNARWYAHANPDVLAANIDPLAHWLSYGRWEGRPAYEGAAAWRPAVAGDYFGAPAPTARMPDLWLPAGATSARVQLFLERFGEPAERSAFVQLVARNGTLIYGGYLAQMAPCALLPSTGSRCEWVIPLAPGARGAFTVLTGQSHDTPGIAATMTVHVGEAPPAGVALGNPAALPALAPTPVPGAIAGTADFDNDLSSLAGFDTHAFAVNAMHGVFADPGRTVTLSGAHPDTLPWVPGVGRRLLPIDQREDLVEVGDGTTARFAMPAVARATGGATGTWLVRAILPAWVEGEDPGVWGIAQDGSWPPELDHVERFSWMAGFDFTTFHGPNNVLIGFGAPNAPAGWHERVWQRLPATPTALATYRQWVRPAGGEWTLVVECPDYLAGQALGTTVSIEGMTGGAAGGSEPPAGWDALAAGGAGAVNREAYWGPR